MRVFIVGLWISACLFGLGMALGVPISYAAESISKTPPKQGPAVQKSEKTLVFIGDSLTEGYGVNLSEAFPEVVRERLATQGHKVRVINGGISGSVSADAEARVKWHLKSKPDVIVLALGANDGLKGTPPAQIKKNLAAAIDLAKANHVKVLLCGIRIFTNFGSDYIKNFEKIYPELVREKKVAFLPFLLEGVALKKELNQSDGKHPNAKGHKIIGDLVMREVEKLL